MIWHNLSSATDMPSCTFRAFICLWCLRKRALAHQKQRTPSKCSVRRESEYGSSFCVVGYREMRWSFNFRLYGPSVLVDLKKNVLR